MKVCNRLTYRHARHKNRLNSLGSAANQERTIVESENTQTRLIGTISFIISTLCDKKRASNTATHNSNRGIVNDRSAYDTFSGATFVL